MHPRAGVWGTSLLIPVKLSSAANKLIPQTPPLSCLFYPPGFYEQISPQLKIKCHKDLLETYDLHLTDERPKDPPRSLSCQRSLSIADAVQSWAQCSSEAESWLSSLSPHVLFAAPQKEWPSQTLPSPRLNANKTRTWFISISSKSNQGFGRNNCQSPGQEGTM